MKVLNLIFTRWKFVTLYSHAESLKPYIYELKVLKPYIHELKVWNPIHELKVWNPIIILKLAIEF